MIQFDVTGTEFLDLFSGSGGIGIEALSRDAVRAVFVDNSPKAVKVIQENLVHTRFTEQALVIPSDYMSAISRLEGKGYHFGIVFMDPPYGQGLERKAMQLLKNRDYVGPDTLFIIEAALEDDLSEIEDYGYVLLREKTYKTNKHVFFALKEDRPDSTGEGTIG